MKKHYLSYLLLLLIVPFISCKKSDSTTANQGSIFVSFAVSPELMIDQKQTKAASLPPIADFIITITAQGATTPLHTFTYDQRPEKLQLESGTYTFACHYGDTTISHSTTPIYNTSQSLDLKGRPQPYPITFKPERTHLCMDVKYSPGFDTYYENYSVEVSSPALSENITFGENGQNPTHYFKRGAAYTATLNAIKKSTSTPVSSQLAAISSDTPQNYHLLTLTFGAPAFDAQIKEYRVVKTVGYIYNSTVVNGPTQSQLSSTAPLKQVTYNLDGADITPADHGITATIGDYNQAITYDQLITPLLPATATDGNKVLTITATDQNDKTATQTINIIVEEPQFTISELTAGNMWNKSADFVVTYSPNYLGLFDAPKVQYSQHDGQWTDANVAKNADQPTTTVCNRITNLASGTKYAFRAVMGDYDKTTAALLTETPIQLPNNNFQTNYNSNGTYACYYFFANGASADDQWWATRNPKTTASGSNYHYVKYSGARPTSGQGVELVTCGWGSGNSASGGISMIFNISAGAIFLGTSNSSSENHGKTFNSRPTSMKFDFKYAPYNNKGDKYVAKIWLENRDDANVTQLAYGESIDGAAVSSWTKQTITLSYSNTELPITHLCVAFYSGVNENPSDDENNTGWVKDPGFTKNEPSRGSVFNVNNIELIYEK